MIIDSSASSVSLYGTSRLSDPASVPSKATTIAPDIATAAVQATSPGAAPVSNSAPLSTATSAALLSLTQETNVSDSSASSSQQVSSSASPSADAESDITQAAQDPTAAEGWIQQQMSGPVAICISMDFLPNQAKAAREGNLQLAQAMEDQIDNASKLSNDVYQQKLSLYQSDVSAGKSSTQIMGDLLKFNADLPSSYYQTLDQSDTPAATKAVQAAQQVQQAQADLAAYQQQTQTA